MGLGFQARDEVDVTRILELGSPIVQISVSSDDSILVVSTEQRTVICDNSKKTFREAGSKSRNGPFGATVVGVGEGQGDILCARPGDYGSFYGLRIMSQPHNTFEFGAE